MSAAQTIEPALAAMNATAEALAAGLTEDQNDLVNFVVNMSAHLMEHPQALEAARSGDPARVQELVREVIEANYAGGEFLAELLGGVIGS